MRGSYTLLATFFVILFLCEGYGFANYGFANIVIKQNQKQDPKKGDQKKGDTAQVMAEQMAETLSRQLKQQLSWFTAQSATQKSARKTQIPKKEESVQTSIQDSLYASVSETTPQLSEQQSTAPGQQPPQTTGHDRNNRPQLRLPQDKPLGAAGPSRNKRPGPEDADFIVVQDRWREGVPEDPRFRRGSIFDPYHQNVMKGDYPIIGNDIFMNLNFAVESSFNYRQLPNLSGISADLVSNSEFFGGGRQEFSNENLIYSLDIFKGDTSFKPADWRFKVTGVSNFNFLQARENGISGADPRNSRTRVDGFNSIEEAFVEWRLGDTPKALPFLRGKGSEGGRSPFFDTTSIRVGIQEFTSDFRGFVFSDSNLGARLFGNFRSNRYQYNAVYFNMLEKDANSELNQINFKDIAWRDQRVYIANLYRQDTFVKGYTLQFSALYNDDQPSTFENGSLFQARPSPLGASIPHHVQSGYFGVNGDGHFGRLNVTNSFYQVIGRDTFNGLADRPERINAQMGAVEFSMDHDFFRYRLAGFYASGDSKPTDGTARGFDAIVDRPNFAGGEFSFWNQQEIRLNQTGVELVGPNSLLPALRSNKIQGQSNFVNPGLELVNAGIDADVTPKLRAFFNYNYLRFVRTEPLELALSQENIRHEIGHDLGIGFIFRPLLSENIILTAGASGLKPGRGFNDIYSSNCNGVPQGCGANTPTLFSTFVKVKFRY
ncbi:MAG: hypothetical protein J2P21_21865 [Chloracidobacterium sp.]|nr:hypothetical protein [Chloracidobacterium sp.]